MVNMELLTDEEKLTFAIGRIERADVFAEDECRIVFDRMASPGLGNRLVPRDFARIIDDCKLMLEHPMFGSFIRSLATEIFTEAQAAHQLRSQLAHDRWVQDRPDQQVWTSVRSRITRPKPQAVSQRALDEFSTCADRLTRVAWRLRALAIILPGWMGSPDVLDGHPSTRIRWTSVAQDSFVFVEPDGITINFVDSPPTPSQLGGADSVDLGDVDV